MPVTLPPLTRRSFLGGLLAAGIAGRQARALDADPARFFLLSDTHIAADENLLNLGVNMSAHLKQAVAELLAENVRPAAVLFNGDMPFKLGESAEYARFLEWVKPLRGAGLPLHLTLGNHDDRAHFWTALEKDPDAGKAPGAVVEERYVSVVESGRANWVLLDSLDKTNSAPGLLGKKQLQWLGETLDAHKDKPAIVMVHHQPVFKNPNTAGVAGTGGKADGTKPAAKNSGLTDTEEFWAVLAPRKQVKALIFGHTHNWSVTRREGVHLINLPAVGYPFVKDKPTGWVDCQLAENGMALTLHCIDKAHPKHGEKVALEWRA